MDHVEPLTLFDAVRPAFAPGAMARRPERPTPHAADTLPQKRSIFFLKIENRAMDYHAVDPLLIAIEKLDRYHGVARRRPADSPEPPPRLEAAVAPLALVYARQEAGAAASPPTPAGPSPRA